MKHEPKRKPLGNTTATVWPTPQADDWCGEHVLSDETKL